MRHRKRLRKNLRSLHPLPKRDLFKHLADVELRYQQARASAYTPPRWAAIVIAVLLIGALVAGFVDGARSYADSQRYDPRPAKL